MTATATATAPETTDRIERSIHIQAPRNRVWRAVAEAGEFGRWFGVDLQGKRFAPGERVTGPFTIEGHTHMEFDVVIERVEPERLLAWRWHPQVSGTTVDPKEERTTVTLTLEDAPGGGILLVVVETGFDKVAPDRRMQAFRGNTGGWEWQLQRVAAHAAAH